MATEAKTEAPKTAPKPAAVNRMTLDSIKRGRISRPIRGVLYGPHGCGKSTFASNAPKPAFLCSEAGTEQLDVFRFPEPKTWGEVFDAIRTLRTSAHDYQTIVVDTLDWLEPMCWKFVCERAGEASIESFGFGKGYIAALSEWRHLLSALETLWREKNMNVVLLAHAQVKTWKNPGGDDYDRYTMQLNDKATGVISQWCDVVLFTNYETHVIKSDKKATKGKAYADGSRVIFTERRAAYDAKNRYDLPEQLPLDWDEFAAAVAAHNSAGAIATLRTQIEDTLPLLPDDKRAAITAWLATDKAQLSENLRVTLNKTQGLLAQIAANKAAQTDEAKEANQ